MKNPNATRDDSTRSNRLGSLPLGRSTLYVGLAVLLFGCSPKKSANSPEDRPESDLAKLQGEWLAVESDPRVGEIRFSLLIHDNQVKASVTFPKDGTSASATVDAEIEIDEKASPKTCDWITTPGPNEPDPSKRRQVGIYILDGDTFIICKSAADKDRPTEFRGGANGIPILRTYQRVKRSP